MNTENIKQRYNYSKTICGLHEGIFAWSRKLYSKDSWSVRNGERLGCEWKDGLFRAKYEIDNKYKYEFEIKNSICDICDKVSKNKIFDKKFNKEMEHRLFVVLWYMEILKRNKVFNQKDSFVINEVKNIKFLDETQKHLILNAVIPNYFEQRKEIFENQKRR